MTQELSAGSILSLMETTKAERQSFAQSIINDLREGVRNPMDVHLQVKCMEELAAELKETPEYKEMLIEATTRQCGGQKSVMYHNAKFEVKEAGTKYDYSSCGDLVLPRLEEQAKKIAAAIKARQEMLKVQDGSLNAIDNETGEVMTFLPPVKTSTTIVAVTLK